MKLKDISGKDIGKRELPGQFHEDIRPDIIERGFLALMSHKRQPYGADPEAGKRSSAKLSRRRRNYRGAYGYGISRVPRKILSRMGRRFSWVGAFAPGTVGGRKAHAPKSSRLFYKKINRKERLKAIRSAMSATVNKELVEKRGHILPDDYPFIVDSKIESLESTREIKVALEQLGLKNELERTLKKKVRAGKGKSRGRKYRKKKGPLIVVSKDSKLSKAAGNIPGIDIVQVDKINLELLAPGAVPGRLTLWTSKAIEMLEKNNYFR